MLNERQSHILRLLVKAYIETGRPVGSQALVDAHELDFSPATVRNDCGVLEEEGYITQPHTSAGRIPTLKGYQYFVTTLAHEVDLVRKFKTQLRTAMRKDTREITRVLASLTGESVVWVERGGRMHYSGMGTLLAHPEFENSDMRSEVGHMLEDLDAFAERLDKGEAETIECVVGDERLLPSAQCSALTLKINKDGNSEMIVVIGPLRMDYERAMAFLELVKQLYETN